MRRIGRQFFEQWPIDKSAQGLVTPLEGGTKGRFLLQEFPSHAQPLPAVTGEYENRLGLPLPLHVADRNAGVNIALQKTSELFRQFGAGVSGQSQPVRAPGLLQSRPA